MKTSNLYEFIYLQYEIVLNILNSYFIEYLEYININEYFNFFKFLLLNSYRYKPNSAQNCFFLNVKISKFFQNQ